MIEKYMRPCRWKKEQDGKMLTPLWLMVTKDKYQLPLAVADTAEELAEIVGVKPSTIIKSVTHRKKSRYIRIYVDMEEERENES